MSEQVMIRPWGNSQGIRIPKSILEKLNISIFRHWTDILYSACILFFVYWRSLYGTALQGVAWCWIICTCKKTYETNKKRYM